MIFDGPSHCALSHTCNLELGLRCTSCHCLVLSRASIRTPWLGGCRSGPRYEQVSKLGQQIKSMMVNKHKSYKVQDA